MYKLYTDIRYAEGQRLMRGTIYGIYATYEEAVEVAIFWLSQDKNRNIMDLCIVSDAPPEPLILGDRYDVYTGILSYSGKSLLFEDIQIHENPYRITGIYRGKLGSDDHGGRPYIWINSVSGFTHINGMDYGKHWMMRNDSK